jgi:hypothetical protein
VKEVEEKRMKRGERVRLDLSEGDVICDNTNQHSLTRPFDLHCLCAYFMIYSPIHTVQVLSAYHGL